MVFNRPSILLLHYDFNTYAFDMSHYSHIDDRLRSLLKLSLFTYSRPNKKLYTPYEGLNLADQMSRKLGVFGRKLEGSHLLF